MKALSIQQPWGSLIACGLKDIENRTSRMLVPPQRVLIHVGAKSRGQDLNDLPLCWNMPIGNAHFIGQFDRDMAFPKSAIIGYVDVVDIVQDSQSIWAQYAPESAKPFQHYVLRNAHLFKEPILNVKGRLGVWDIPEIDENNLPETVDIPKLERMGDTIVFPCNEYIWDIVCEWMDDQDEESLEFPIYLIDNNFDLLIENKEELEPYQFKKILLTNNGDGLEFNLVEVYIEDLTYEDSDEVVQYYTPSGEIRDGKRIVFLIEHPSKNA